MKRISVLAVILAVLAACDHPVNGRTAWNDVLKNCAFSELNSDKVLYFGPSNSVGPGSIWRKAAAGGYRLRWTLAEMPNHDQFIEAGQSFNCAGTKSSATSLAASLGFAVDPTPLSAEFSTDLKSARSVEVRPAAVSWDLIKEGPFEAYIRDLPSSSGPRADLEGGDRLVMYRALQVAGYSVKLEFENKDAMGLKAKYSGTLPTSLTGKTNLGLTANWSESGTLTLVSTEKFYIAGEIVRYDPTGFAGDGSALGSHVLIVGKDAAVARESPH